MTMTFWPRPATIALALVLSLGTACGDGAPPTDDASPTTGGAAAFSETARITLYGGDPGDRAGAVLSGDFNGDGVPDLLLTAARADGPDNARPDTGEAYVFLGPFSPGDDLDVAAGEYDAIIYGVAPGDQFGQSAAAGDFNGDGITDMVLASPFGDADSSRVDSGTISVLFGSRGLGLDVRRIDLAAAAADATALGAAAGDVTGFMLASADLDGDGRSDLIAGALLSDGPSGDRPDGGAVYAIYGAHLRPRIDFARGEQDVAVYGAKSGDRLGEGVAAGDVNGDGRADLIAAATFAGGPSGDREAAGEVHVLLAPLEQRLDLAHDEPALTVLGTDPGDQIGHSLASGDTNGDGLADLWLGSVSADGPTNGADLAGEVSLVLGSQLSSEGRTFIDTATDGGAALIAALIYGPGATARLGRSAAVADANGDGLADLLISAPDVEVRRGAIFLLSGRSDPVGYPQSASGADFVLTGLDAGDVLGHESFGTPPFGAADLDGDHRPEILAVAPLGAGPRNDRPEAGEAYAIFLQPHP